MNVSSIGHKLKEYKYADGKEKLKELLAECCNNDFNGKNGEEYYIKKNVFGKEISMSELDSIWLDVKGLSEKEIIYKVLKANYSNPYYSYYNIKVKEDKDKIIFSCLYAD